MSKYKPTRLIELVKEVPNPDVAWAIGFIAADGYLVSRARTDTLRIELNPKDIDALEKVRLALDFEDRPITQSRKWNKTHKKFYDAASLSVYKKGLVEAFCQWGISPDKTDNMFLHNNIPYFRDFFRGFFDGDGYITSRKDPRRKNSTRTEFGFAIKSEQMRSDIKEFLEYEFGAHVTEFNIKLVISSGKPLPQIFDYLYKDSSTYLTRKKEVFTSIIDHLNQT